MNRKLKRRILLNEDGSRIDGFYVIGLIRRWMGWKEAFF